MKPWCIQSKFFNDVWTWYLKVCYCTFQYAIREKFLLLYSMTFLLCDHRILFATLCFAMKFFNLLPFLLELFLLSEIEKRLSLIWYHAFYDISTILWTSKFIENYFWSYWKSLYLRCHVHDKKISINQISVLTVD